MAMNRVVIAEGKVDVGIGQIGAGIEFETGYKFNKGVEVEALGNGFKIEKDLCFRGLRWSQVVMILIIIFSFDFLIKLNTI